MSDLRFLPHALTLCASVADQSDPARGTPPVTILATDAPAAAYLRADPPRHTGLVELNELERGDPELARVRGTRSWREYCWTAIPSLCWSTLHHVPAGSLVAWLDADIELLADVRELAAALGDGSVLLTPHRYRRAFPAAAPARVLTRRYGSFNGGSIVFRRDEQGLAAAALWRERTIAWCYDRLEPGRYGNQLHLEDFLERFDRARVLPVPGGVLGPWNGGRFRVRRGPAGRPARWSADGQALLAYHYQSLVLRPASPTWLAPLLPGVIRLGAVGAPLEASAAPHYRITRRERRLLWRPYVRRLEPSVRSVMAREPAFLDALAPAASRTELLGAVVTAARLHASRVGQSFRSAVAQLRARLGRRAQRWRGRRRP